MSQILILNQNEMESLLTLSEAIESVEAAYAAKENKTGTLFPFISHEFFSGSGEVDIMSGHLRINRVYGLKLTSRFPENRDYSLPSIFATSLIFDDRTGEPLALLNASGLTYMRTGAAGAISMKYLARENSKTLLLVGMGRLAPYLAAAALFVMPRLDTLYVYNPHGLEKAQQREPEFMSTLEKLLSSREDKEYRVCLCEDLAKAALASDIIVTATPSKIPLIQMDWIRPGTHICAIGSDMKGKQELDSFILTHSSVYVDDKAQAAEIGEVEIPLMHGLIRLDDLQEMGELLATKTSGRQSEEEITLFDATGIALQDISIARRIYDLAIRANKGTMIEL